MKPRKAAINNPTNDVAIMICAYNKQEMIQKIISENEGFVVCLFVFSYKKITENPSSATWEIHWLLLNLS